MFSVNTKHGSSAVFSDVAAPTRNILLVALPLPFYSLINILLVVRGPLQALRTLQLRLV